MLYGDILWRVLFDISNPTFQCPIMSYSLQAGCKEGAQTGNVAILAGHSIGHSKQQTVYVHVFYSERFVWKSYFIVQEVGFGV